MPDRNMQSEFDTEMSQSQKSWGFKSMLIILGKVFIAFEYTFSFFLTGFIILGLVVGVCLEVLLRTIMNISIIGLPEVAELTVVVITFLGLSQLQRVHGHLRMDSIYILFMKRQVGQFIEVAHILLSVAFFSFISYALIWIMMEAYRTRHTTMGIYMPIWPVFAVVVLGSLTVLIRLCLQLIEGLKQLINNRKRPINREE